MIVRRIVVSPSVAAGPPVMLRCGGTNSVTYARLVRSSAAAAAYLDKLPF